MFSMVFKFCKPSSKRLLIVSVLQGQDNGAIPVVLCEMNCILGYECPVKSHVLKTSQCLGPARRKVELPR